MIHPLSDSSLPAFSGEDESVLNELVANNLSDSPDGVGVVCLLCGSHLKDGGRCNVRRHMKDMHLYSGLRFRCPACSRVYKSQNSLRTHASMYHKGVKLRLDVSRTMVRPRI